MLKEIRQAIAAAVSASLPNIQASAYQLANPTPPCAWVYPAETEYDQAMQRGMDTYTFTLQVFVADVADRGSQERLDRMLEPSGGESIKDAVETDSTLGGLVYSCRVVSNSGYQRYQREGGGTYLGADFNLEVLASGE